MKIHIYYRHYAVSGTDGKQRPHWFDYEKCFQNLLITSDEDVKINVVYDGSLGDGNFIHKYTDQINSLTPISAKSDFKSFQHTCDLIKNNNTIASNDIVYFLENDYLHVQGWDKDLVNLFNTYETSYVSLYDHNDKYFLPQYEDLISKIFTTSTRHWRTTPSTCNTFAISKKLFDQDYDILSTMEGDHNKFLWLTEHRDRYVVTPIPGLSTHCMSHLLSPTINWSAI